MQEILIECCAAAMKRETVTVLENLNYSIIIIKLLTCFKHLPLDN